MQKTNRLHRLLTVIVAVFMAVCCLPLNAFAEGEARETVRVDFSFVDESGTEVKSLPAQIITKGEHDYSEIEAEVPEGYTLVDSGKFTVAGDGKIVVKVKKNATDGVMTIRFMEGETFVSGGDYRLPLGTQNYSILEQYVPEGYVMTASGDFMVTDGGKLDVAVQKIATEGVMNIRFMDGETFVSGGDYTLPLGTQNYSILEQYVPAGYVMTVSGDFTVTDGGKLDVAVQKIATEGVMNIRFMDGETFVSGGDYTLPLGTQNYSILEQYVPAGYVMAVSGDFTVTDGGKLDVAVEKIVTDAIVNIRYMDGDTVVEGGDYSFTAGATITFGSLQLPAGYELDTDKNNADSGFVAKDGAQIIVHVKKIEQPAGEVVMNIRFVDSVTGEFVAGGDYFLPAGVQNYNVLTQYLPEGYKMDVAGDFTVAEGTSLDVPVSKLSDQIIMNIRFVDSESNTFVAGGDYFLAQGVHNYTILKDLGYLPEGYEMDVSGDFMAKDGAKLEVPVHKIKDDSGDGDGDNSGSDGENAGSDNSGSGNGSASSNNASSTQNTESKNQVVKADAPADNSAKVLPQTGLTAEQPVVFGGMLLSALGSAAAYLFAIRRKLI